MGEVNPYEYNNNLSVGANGGTTLHQGLEASTSLRLSDQLEAKIAYSYSTHKYENDPKYKSNEMASAPNWINWKMRRICSKIAL